MYEAASKNLVPVTLELGGKSPVIVDDTANIKVASIVLVSVNLLMQDKHVWLRIIY